MRPPPPWLRQRQPYRRISKDRLAASSAELVGLAADTIRRVATPAEARAALGLP